MSEIDIPRGIIKEIKLKPNAMGDIPFHIPEEGKTPGMEYRWIATTLTKYGREVMRENLEEAARRGWLPVSRSRNPLLMNETREHYSIEDYIMEQAHLLAGRLAFQMLGVNPSVDMIQSRVDSKDITPLALDEGGRLIDKQIEDK